MQSAQRVPPHLPMLFLSLGVLLASAAVFMTLRRLSDIVGADQHLAIVTENPCLRGRPIGSTRNLFRPVVTFRDHHGTPITAPVAQKSGRHAFSVGAEIRIRHRRDSAPPRIRIDSFSGLWVEPLILGVIGTGFLGGAAHVRRIAAAESSA